MPDRHGAARTQRFSVVIDGADSGPQTIQGFTSVTLPTRTVEQTEYREGNNPNRNRKVAGKVTYGDLELERGAHFGELQIEAWHDIIKQGSVDTNRADITIFLMDQNGNPQTRWDFRNCWLKEYDPPDLDADSDAEVATETYTIAVEKMERTSVSGEGGAAQAGGAAPA